MDHQSKWTMVEEVLDFETEDKFEKMYVTLNHWSYVSFEEEKQHKVEQK